MGRLTRTLRRRWVHWAAQLVQVLWWCPCDYTNVATYRCYLCGARPPREIRDLLRAVPIPDVETPRPRPVA